MMLVTRKYPFTQSWVTLTWWKSMLACTFATSKCIRTKPCLSGPGDREKPATWLSSSTLCSYRTCSNSCENSAAFVASWERKSLTWRSSDCWAATTAGSETGLLGVWADPIEPLRSGDHWALSWAGLAALASCNATMTGLNIAMTWLAMAVTSIESTWGPGVGRPDK